jgi:hypothetical protein
MKERHDGALARNSEVFFSFDEHFIQSFTVASKKNLGYGIGSAMRAMRIRNPFLISGFCAMYLEPCIHYEVAFLTI